MMRRVGAGGKGGADRECQTCVAQAHHDTTLGMAANEKGTEHPYRAAPRLAQPPPKPRLLWLNWAAAVACAAMSVSCPSANGMWSAGAAAGICGLLVNLAVLHRALLREHTRLLEYEVRRLRSELSPPALPDHEWAPEQTAAAAFKRAAGDLVRDSAVWATAIAKELDERQ